MEDEDELCAGDLVTYSAEVYKEFFEKGFRTARMHGVILYMVTPEGAMTTTRAKTSIVRWDDGSIDRVRTDDLCEVNSAPHALLNLGEVVALALDYLDSKPRSETATLASQRGILQNFISPTDGGPTRQRGTLAQVVWMEPPESRGKTQVLNTGNLCRPGSLKFVEREPRRSEI